MTDREMLELAAKAMGYTTNSPWNKERLELDPPVISLVVRKDGELVHTAWNPLRDDGPSRLIEVALDLTVDRRRAADGSLFIRVGWGSPLMSHLADFMVAPGDDAADGARRAVLMAAVNLQLGRKGQKLLP